MQKRQYKYKAFISYSHKDKSFARWVHKSIENYKIPKSLREKYPNLPKDLKRSIFRDEEELPTSASLPDNLSNALESSELIIVICSPDAVKSHWVDKEIRYFKQVYGEGKVLAIIKKGEPNKSNTFIYDDEDEAFPRALRYKIDENGELTRDRVEPIASDARSFFNRKKALMRLIAGILKVDFADLQEREKREARKRNMIKGAILSLIIALGLYFATNTTANSTNKELENLLKNQATIEYKLRHGNLTQAQRAKLYDVLDKIKESIKNKKSTLKWLGKNKTEFLEHIAKIYNTKGVDEAIKALETNEANREKKKKDISKEYITLAKLYVEKNQYKKADKTYQKAIDEFFDIKNISEYASFLNNQMQLNKSLKLYNKLLTNNIPLKEKIGILHNISLIYYDKSELNNSKKLLLKALELFDDLPNKKTDDNQFLLGTILNSLGMTYNRLNKLDKALFFYYKALDIRVKLNDLYYFADTSTNIGIILMEQHKLIDAEIIFSEVLKIRKYLAENKAKNSQERLGNIYINLGNLYIKKGEKKKAIKFFNKALQIYKTLAKKNPNAENKKIGYI